jgi:hypothetical protein
MVELERTFWLEHASNEMMRPFEVVAKVKG